jgi:hypothetical protein
MLMESQAVANTECERRLCASSLRALNTRECERWQRAYRLNAVNRRECERWQCASCLTAFPGTECERWLCAYRPTSVATTGCVRGLCASSVTTVITSGCERKQCACSLTAATTTVPPLHMNRTWDTCEKKVTLYVRKTVSENQGSAVQCVCTPRTSTLCSRNSSSSQDKRTTSPFTTIYTREDVRLSKRINKIPSRLNSSCRKGDRCQLRYLHPDHDWKFGTAEYDAISNQCKTGIKQ